MTYHREILSLSLSLEMAEPTVDSKQRNMETPDYRPFACDSCDKRYLRKNNLEDHVLMEHPDTDQVRRTLFNN